MCGGTLVGQLGQSESASARRLFQAGQPDGLFGRLDRTGEHIKKRAIFSMSAICIPAPKTGPSADHPDPATCPANYQPRWGQPTGGGRKLDLGAPPTGRTRLGLATKPALSLAGADLSLVVVFLTRDMVDAFAGSDANVALDVALARRRLGDERDDGIYRETAV